MAQPNAYSSYRLFDNRLEGDLNGVGISKAFVLRLSPVISTSRLVFTFSPALKILRKGKGGQCHGEPFS